jgi:hypothetical protein
MKGDVLVSSLSTQTHVLTQQLSVEQRKYDGHCNNISSVEEKLSTLTMLNVLVSSLSTQTPVLTQQLSVE